MAEIEKHEFVFPDEVADENPRKGGRVVEPEETVDEKPEVEVVDDTPPADRGRTPLAEPPKEVTDEELAKYDESIQTRIKRFTRGYHDERRAKEQAQREREEAIRLAQAAIEENKRLKGSLGQNQQVMFEAAKRTSAVELEQAKAKYRAAYESGDADAVVEAQEALTSAKIKAERLASFKPPVRQTEEIEVQPQQVQPPAPQPDSRAQEWQSKNQWFGQDEEMTSFALGLHTKLVKQGVDPRSDEYYDKLNGRLKQVFPDAFESEEPADAPPQRKKSNVAPATRSTAPKKIVLTQSQVNIAKRLGVPLELYARKVAEEMRK